VADCSADALVGSLVPVLAVDVLEEDGQQAGAEERRAQFGQWQRIEPMRTGRGAHPAREHQQQNTADHGYDGDELEFRLVELVEQVAHEQDQV
jgi:hypothetical protein